MKWTVTSEPYYRRGKTQRYSVDNTKGYSVDNCKWASRVAQNNNTRANVRIMHDGKNLTLAEWSRETGIGYFTLHSRYKRGGTAAQILAPLGGDLSISD